MEISSVPKYDYLKLYEDKDFFILWNEFKVLSDIFLSQSYLMSINDKRSFYKRLRGLNKRLVNLIECVDNLNSNNYEKSLFDYCPF